MIDDTKKYFNSKLGNGNRVSAIVSSGRAAIHFVIMKTKPEKVYIPEYICNAVQVASEEHSIIEYYRIDEKYKFDLSEIVGSVQGNRKCCVILPSFLSRKYDIKTALAEIRAANDQCVIILDECQNLMDISLLPHLGKNVYAIYSFNNKATYGFLGGMIIQPSDADDTLSDYSIPAPSMQEEWHARYAAALSFIRDILSGSAFPVPERAELSHCRGIYSVLPKQPLKVSIAAASLIPKYKQWYERCIYENRKIVERLADEKVLSIVAGNDDCAMPYIPVTFENDLIRSVPLKGPYGCSNDSADARQYAFILHNSMILRRSKQ